MLTTTVFKDGKVVHGTDLAEVADCVGDDSCVVWVDSTGPEEGDLDKAAELFELHELAVEDVSKHGQRAKLQHYPNHSFVVVYARAADGDLSEVDVFVGSNWVFTVRERNEHGELLDLGEVKHRLEQRRDLDVSAGLDPVRPSRLRGRRLLRRHRGGRGPVGGGRGGAVQRRSAPRRHRSSRASWRSVGT